MNTSLRSRETKVDLIMALIPDPTFGGRGRLPYGPPKVILAGDRDLQGLVIPIATWFEKAVYRYWDNKLSFNYDLDHIILERQTDFPIGS